MLFENTCEINVQACQIGFPQKASLGNSVSFPQWLVSMCPVFQLPASSDLPIEHYLGSTLNWITEMTWPEDPSVAENKRQGRRAGS